MSVSSRCRSLLRAGSVRVPSTSWLTTSTSSSLLLSAASCVADCEPWVLCADGRAMAVSWLMGLGGSGFLPVGPSEPP